MTKPRRLDTNWKQLRHFQHIVQFFKLVYPNASVMLHNCPIIYFQPGTPMMWSSLRFELWLRSGQKKAVRAGCFFSSYNAAPILSGVSSPLLLSIGLISLLLSLLLSGSLPVSVAARGECVDGAAQRRRLNSLPCGGGAGEWWRMASFATGYKQFRRSGEPPQSSVVFRPGTLPGELFYPNCYNLPWIKLM